uniref:Secreted protein n=1 Tax=Caenorhabditis japonica TaxID=281687 RepID=A0A8R1E7W4_CAEJA
MPNKTLVAITVYIFFGFVSYSVQCDCSPSCMAYVTPSQCVRCCTHSVKRRSLLYRPAHHKRAFLEPAYRQSQIQSSLPRFIVLLLENNRV